MAQYLPSVKPVLQDPWKEELRSPAERWAHHPLLQGTDSDPAPVTVAGALDYFDAQAGC